MKRSTVTNLTETLNDWTLVSYNKQSITAAHVDFSKAFDTVSRSKLVNKLRAYGVSGNLLLWINDSLAGRSQLTKAGISQSSELNIEPAHQRPSLR
jgi:Reverse transcriptase (RNA-dependent DNA polymerase)